MVVNESLDAHEVQLGTEQLSLYLTLQASIPGRFTDNVLTLLPGESVNVGFIPESVTDQPVEFNATDLYSSYNATSRVTARSL